MTPLLRANRADLKMTADRRGKGMNRNLPRKGAMEQPHDSADPAQYFADLLAAGAGSPAFQRAPPWLQAEISRLWEDGQAGHDVHADADRVFRQFCAAWPIR